MNKRELESQIKSTGTAYLLYLFGFHYIYLGKIGTQFLYWCTFGGVGIWALIDLFTMSSKVAQHNAPIFQQLDMIERMEKIEDNGKMMAMISGGNISSPASSAPQPKQLGP